MVDAFEKKLNLAIRDFSRDFRFFRQLRECLEAAEKACEAHHKAETEDELKDAIKKAKAVVRFTVRVVRESQKIRATIGKGIDKKLDIRKELKETQRVVTLIGRAAEHIATTVTAYNKNMSHFLEEALKATEEGDDAKAREMLTIVEQEAERTRYWLNALARGLQQAQKLHEKHKQIDRGSDLEGLSADDIVAMMRKRYQYDPNKQMKAVLAKIHARGKEHRRGHTRRSMVKAVLILSEKATCANYPPPEKLDEDLLAAVKKLDAKLRDKILNNFALNMERRVRRKETSRGSPNKHWSDEIITLARLKEECGGEAGGVEILGEDLGYDVAFIFVMNRERLDYKTETRMFDPSQFVGGRINNLPNTFTRKERQAVEREHVVYAQEYFQKAQGHGYGPLWWYARLLFALNNDGRWDAVGAYFESKNRDINVLTDSPTLYDDQRRSFRGWGLHYAEKFHEYLGVPYRDLLWFVGKNERDNEVSQFITKVLKTKQKDDVAAVADYFSRAPISDGYSHGNFKTLDIVDIQLQAGHIDRALQLASMESSHERGRLLIHIADTAEGHFDAAKVKHARAQGHKLLGKKKNAIPLYEELGDEAMEAGNHRAASDHYKDALALNPGWGRALLIRRKLKKLPVGYW